MFDIIRIKRYYKIVMKNGQIQTNGHDHTNPTLRAGVCFS